MNALAKNIALPDSFVEIRHSATHDTLPSLVVLRRAVRRALHWLWTSYWDVSPSTSQNAVETENQAELYPQIKSIIKTWRRARSEQLATAVAPTVDSSGLAVFEAVNMITDGPLATSIFTQILLADRYLLNDEKLFNRWQPFLDIATGSLRKLRMSLLLTSVDLLKTIESDDRIASDSMLPGPTTQSLARIEPRKLCDLILWLATEDLKGNVDPAALLKAISIQKGANTLSLLQRLSLAADFEDAGRLLALRQALDANDLQAAKALKNPAGPRISPALGKTTKGKFEQIEYDDEHPIGEYIGSCQ